MLVRRKRLTRRRLTLNPSRKRSSSIAARGQRKERSECAECESQERRGAGCDRHKHKTREAVSNRFQTERARVAPPPLESRLAHCAMLRAAGSHRVVRSVAAARAADDRAERQQRTQQAEADSRAGRASWICRAGNSGHSDTTRRKGGGETSSSVESGAATVLSSPLRSLPIRQPNTARTQRQNARNRSIKIQQIGRVWSGVERKSAEAAQRHNA